MMSYKVKKFLVYFTSILNGIVLVVNDVTIITQNLEELEISVYELSVASMQHGLKINMAKTKVLRNKHVTQRPVIVGGSVIEEVHSYIYLGQRVSLLETDMANEISRRIQAGWKSFKEHKIVLKSNIPNSLKKLYNQCVLPAICLYI